MDERPKSSKPITGNIPFRALIDRELEQLDRHVIAAIAAFDRMAARRGGQGCTAGTNRLALIVAAHPSNVSKSISKLRGAGYVEERPSKKGRGGKGLFVIYDERDGAAFDAVYRADVRSTDQISLADVRSTDRANQPISGVRSPANGPLPPIRDDKRELEERREERIPKIGATKPMSDGHWLRRVEENLSRGGTMSSKLQASLTEIAEGDYGDPNAGRAQRLLETYGPPESTN